MTRNSRILYFFITTIFFVMFNNLITDNILRYGYKIPENPIFDLVYVQNEGAAFNLLDGSKIFLIAFAVIAILGIIFYTIKHIKTAPVLAIFCSSLLISGIFSNMFERITFGFVRDFIKLNFVDFPVFNISDIFINISVIALVIIIIVKKNFVKNNETDNR